VRTDREAVVATPRPARSRPEMRRRSLPSTTTTIARGVSMRRTSRGSIDIDDDWILH
jgi:hypothetical protein